MYQIMMVGRPSGIHTTESAHTISLCIMQMLLPFFTSFPQFNELIKRFENLLIECNVQDTMAPYIPQQSAST